MESEGRNTMVLGRGKGLVAVEELEEGEVIWKEDPWIVAPEWEILDLQLNSVACGHCTTPNRRLFRHHRQLPLRPARSDSAITFASPVPPKSIRFFVVLCPFRY